MTIPTEVVICFAFIRHRNKRFREQQAAPLHEALPLTVGTTIGRPPVGAFVFLSAVCAVFSARHPADGQ